MAGPETREQGRIRFGGAAALGLLAAMVACRAAPSDAGEQPTDASATPELPRGPNLVLILADDLAGGATGFDGCAFARTPRLDALAAEGVSFARAYCPSGWCVPSRASILTGLYPHATGLVENDSQPMAVLPTFASEVRELGLTTAAVGKWHSGNRNLDELGFDHHAVLPVPPSPGDYAEPRFRLYLVDGETVESEEPLSDWFTERALAFARANRERPFLLTVAYNAPHRSGPAASDEFWHWAAGFEDTFDPREVPWPESAAEDLSTKPAYQAADRAHELFERFEPDALRGQIARYHSIVAELDEAIGRLVDGLQELDLLDDTIIVFTSDNGLFLGEHRMLLKGDLLYEEQMRVPLFVRLPPRLAGEAVAGSRSPRVVNLVDLAPTLIELAGGSAPATLHGRSLGPLLRDPEYPAWQDEVLLENGDLRGLVTADAKLVESAAGDLELYDLASDPHELTDLAGRPGSRALLDDLRQRLFRHRVRLADDQRLP